MRVPRDKNKNVHSNAVHNSKNQNNLNIHQLKTIWINILWYRHIMEQYIALKTDGLYLYPVTWLNLGNPMLTTKNKSEKMTYSMIPFL